MNFLNPLVLIGLVAAGIPVLLHLLNLRKLKIIEFSTLKFLKELQKTKIRKFKIKQILLLILRTLLIIFLVFAFARPTIKSSFPFFESYTKTSAIILIDNSYSMDVSDEQGNRFKQAKLAASKIISSLRDGDEAVIIEMANPKMALQYSFSRNFEYLRDRINKIQISNSAASLDKAARISALLSEQASYLNKNIFIISDAQNNIFKLTNNDSLHLNNLFTNVYMIPTGLKSKADIKNLRIDSLNIISGIFQVDKVVEVEAIVKNDSKTEINGVVLSMTFNGVRVAQRSVDIPAEESRNVSIAAPPQIYGPVSAKVELENDAIDRDNTRFFGFNVPGKPKIALIGDINTTNYIKTAIQAISKENEFAAISVSDSKQFSSITLENYDLIIVSGLNNTSDLNRLHRYIQNGGYALLFAFDGIIDNSSKKEFEELGFRNPEVKTFSNNEPQKFSFIDKKHPLFDGVFINDKVEGSSIESPRILKIVPVQAGINIIQTASGSFLAESRLGEGKIIYCGMSPDTKWGNFAITGIFPTLVYRSVIYLTSSEDISDFAISGDKMTMTLPKKFAKSKNFKIIDPQGKDFFRIAAELPGGAVIPFDDLELPGVYTIFDENANFIKQLAVNTDKTESEIKQNSKSIIEDELKSRFGKNADINIVTNYDEISEEIQRARVGTELWQLFIILALMCAIAEMIVQRTSKSDISA
jgi:hypothetical protein